MKLKHFAVSLLLALSAISIAQTYPKPVPVGFWRDHFIYRNVISLTESDTRLYAATTYGLFYIDKNDNAVYRFNKIQGLTSTGVSTINYNYFTKTLVIGYEDGNIDLYQNNSIINLSDIKRKNIDGSKRINKITFDAGIAYLSCNFGIVLIDIARQEIKESYFIGENNSSLQVNEIAILDNNIYAATEKGLKVADKTNPMLNDYHNWITDSFFTADSAITGALTVNNTVFVTTKPYAEFSYFYKQNDTKTSWVYKDSVNSSAVRSCKNNLLIAMKESSGEPRIKVYNNDFTLEHNYPFAGFDEGFWWQINPMDVWISNDNYVWSGTGSVTLFKIKTDESYYSRLYIEDPRTNTIFSLSPGNKSTFVTAGGITPSFAPNYNTYTVSQLLDENWNIFDYNQSCAGVSVRTFDALYTAEDPFEDGHFFVSTWYNGVFEYRNNECTQHYDNTNSTLQLSMDGDGSIRTSGVAFDNSGNFWVANSRVSNTLSMRKSNGTWKGYNLTSLTSDEPNKLIVDYYNQKWITFRKGSLVVAKENGDDIDAVFMNVNNGNDNPTSIVNCVAEDKLGYIWIGTEKGIKVNYTSRKVLTDVTGNTSNAEFKLIIVGDKTSGYPLLSTESVTCIAVDGADRKWLGTQSSGIFLVSADGTEEIHHFTVDNSPLISNTITTVAVDPKTGEVFIGTDKGLMSYQGDATKGGATNSNVLVYPNPVKPNFTGEIAIRGLVDDADVRIADINGNALYHTIAKGGMATWNGRKVDGSKPATGVYFVFATNEDGSETVVAKIIFIK